MRRGVVYNNEFNFMIIVHIEFKILRYNAFKIMFKDKDFYNIRISIKILRLNYNIIVQLCWNFQEY